MQLMGSVKSHAHQFHMGFRSCSQFQQVNNIALSDKIHAQVDSSHTCITHSLLLPSGGNLTDRPGGNTGAAWSEHLHGGKRREERAAKILLDHWDLVYEVAGGL